jgi:MYXO-CTERM domain-containing protein
VTNAAKKCKAERALDPEAFREQYGTNPNKHNAFGKCVSAHARIKINSLDELTELDKLGDEEFEPEADDGCTTSGAGTGAPESTKWLGLVLALGAIVTGRRRFGRGNKKR